MDTALVLPILVALLFGLTVGLVGGFVLSDRTRGRGIGLGPDNREVKETVVAVDRSVQQTMNSHVALLQQELRHVNDQVVTLRRERAEQDGRLVSGLEHTMAATAQLADTTTSLRDALASPKSRGQWGERMAEDVLQMAGFVEGVNYGKQVRLPGGTIPDYTFHLPRGHSVHMDVKFPIDNYLRWLESTSGAVDERETFEKAFRKDVRARVKELAGRDYVDPSTVDYVLLFIPNESVYGFLHEHDPNLIDFALGQKVVLCSPTSLFAVLAVIRQSVDNFMLEQRSDSILDSLVGLRDQWQRFLDSASKIGRGLAAAQNGFDELTGPRARQFEKRLDQLEGMRDGPSIEPPSPAPSAAPLSVTIDGREVPSSTTGAPPAELRQVQ